MNEGKEANEGPVAKGLGPAVSTTVTRTRRAATSASSAFRAGRSKCSWRISRYVSSTIGDGGGPRRPPPPPGEPPGEGGAAPPPGDPEPLDLFWGEQNRCGIGRDVGVGK